MLKIRILLTSPEGYAVRLMSAFEKLDKNGRFQPVSCPFIQTQIHIGSETFQSFIKQLDKYDYIAFSSRKAIEAFALGLEQVGCALPKQTNLCAIGKDNELLCEYLHVEPAFISDEPSPMGIVHHLQNLSVEGKRIAVLAPQVIGMEEPPIVPEFIRALTKIGMIPERITAYVTKATSEQQLVHVVHQIEQHEFDAIVFTSGTEIRVFKQLIMKYKTDSPTVLCYGPYTARCAEQYGVKVDFTSPSFGSFQELVKEIIHFYRVKDTETISKLSK